MLKHSKRIEKTRKQIAEKQKKLEEQEKKKFDENQQTAIGRVINIFYTFKKKYGHTIFYELLVFYYDFFYFFLISFPYWILYQIYYFIRYGFIRYIIKNYKKIIINFLIYLSLFCAIMVFILMWGQTPNAQSVWLWWLYFLSPRAL